MSVSGRTPDRGRRGMVPRENLGQAWGLTLCCRVKHPVFHIRVNRNLGGAT